MPLCFSFSFFTFSIDLLFFSVCVLFFSAWATLPDVSKLIDLLIGWLVDLGLIGPEARILGRKRSKRLTATHSEYL